MSGDEQIIADRDYAQEMADQLADAVARLLSVDVGEHSNLSCRWERALEHLEAEIERQKAGR